jgi:hypothetical protein
MTQPGSKVGMSLNNSAKGLRGLSLGVRRVKVSNLQQVKILPGIWVAPAGSYRNDGGGNPPQADRSLRDKCVASSDAANRSATGG